MLLDLKTRSLCIWGNLAVCTWKKRLFRFFKCLIEDKRHSYKILILSHDDHEHIKTQLTAFEIPEDRYVLKRALRAEVPAYISAADFGFVAVRQRPGKRFCSPIKDGEFWLTINHPRWYI